MYEIIFLIVIILAVFGIWAFVIEPLFFPDTYIYIMEDKGLYLFARGRQRIVFDYLTFLNFGTHGNGTVKNLFVNKYKELDEHKPYFAFDRNKQLVAILPHQSKNGSGFGILDKIALVHPDKTVEWMKIDDFLENQTKIINNVTKKALKK